MDGNRIINGTLPALVVICIMSMALADIITPQCSAITSLIFFIPVQTLINKFSLKLPWEYERATDHWLEETVKAMKPKHRAILGLLSLLVIPLTLFVTYNFATLWFIEPAYIQAMTGTIAGFTCFLSVLVTIMKKIMH